jgi:uncharacterized protein YjbI with pentapeptide repeats
MSPQVTAAWIAAGIGVLTVAATVAAQYFSRRATSRDTQKALAQQSEHLDRTLAEQRKQLDRTLAEQRTRTLNERFATAAGQLGSDKPAAVRLAGVYAMAGLADDWPENRQTCVDVLCGYLRMPYEPNPGQDAPAPERLAFWASRQVRHTVIRVITAHLKPDAAVSWQGLKFDFTDAVFDGGDFRGAEFSGGEVLFDRAVFSGGAPVDFSFAVFSGGEVSFNYAKFSGGEVSFRYAVFSGGKVSFDYAGFSGGEVLFENAGFSGGKVSFAWAKFSGGTTSFYGARFSGGTVDFGAAMFPGGEVSFNHAAFSSGTVSFHLALFSGGTVSFGGESVPWAAATRFSGGTIDFGGAMFSGGEVGFGGAEFSGGTVDFSRPGDWSVPPAFPWTGTPPPGVKLPQKEDQSQA